ncbi:hypothetical protein [Roseburia sp. 499]|uniref:hypothetical protein n=1 Tax=Roseburia sp. 499 TaxID=1261634 RepID=UPI0009531F89|nr:hypothetical protein [Roseburia sp. 499]WVK70853.1 hypothetical protein BIV20_04785 [Roseburia sp. 499]
MGRHVVYDENELSLVTNSMVNYAEFLSRCIEEYITLLDDLQSKGIQDEVICSKIADLETTIKSYKTVIYDECQDIRTKVNKSIEEIALEDDFRFPSDITSVVGSLLSMFL